MESRYGVGINNRYALFIDQDDIEDDQAMLKKAAETAATTKKAKETAQKTNGVAPAAAPKKDVKPAPVTGTPATAPTKKPEGGKGPKGEGNIFYPLPPPLVSKLLRAPCALMRHFVCSGPCFHPNSILIYFAFILIWPSTCSPWTPVCYVPHKKVNWEIWSVNFLVLHLWEIKVDFRIVSCLDTMVRSGSSELETIWSGYWQVSSRVDFCFPWLKS